MKLTTQSWFYRRAVGTALSILAGLAFFALYVIAIGGSMGSQVEHASKNETIFLSWLSVTLGLSIASVLRDGNESAKRMHLDPCILYYFALRVSLR